MNDDELDYYARHIVLPQIGGVGQNKLRSAKVALVGLGGIGAGALPALAGAGIGNLTLIDDDAVDISNLQRQPLYRIEDVGKPKAALAKAWAEARNPHIGLGIVAERVTAENAAQVLADHDLVIYGTDNFATRLLVSDTCVALGIPLISAAAQQLQGQLGLWRARPCYRCFVGDAFDTDDCDTCAETGALGAITSMVGNLAAMTAIRAIVGIGTDDAGTLHLYEGSTNRWRAIAIPADPGCSTCA